MKMLRWLGIAFGSLFIFGIGAQSYAQSTSPLDLLLQYIHINPTKDRVGIHTPFPQTDLHVVGNTMIQGNTAARGKLISDRFDDDADGNANVWIQGGPHYAVGDERNLALLGYDEDSGDALRINFSNDFENGTQFDGNVGIGTAATTAGLTIAGEVRASQYCDINGQNCTSTPNGGSHSCQNTTNIQVVTGTQLEQICKSNFGATTPTCPAGYVQTGDVVNIQPQAVGNPGIQCGSAGSIFYTCTQYAALNICID